MASEEMIQAINKHLMGDAKEFIELRERFEGCNSFQPHAAAALGYLIAKDELEATKEEEEEPDVYDEVVALVDKFAYTWNEQNGFGVGSHTTTDEIFTLIYVWLDKSLAAKGWSLDGTLRTDITELFLPFIIKKSEA